MAERKKMTEEERLAKIERDVSLFGSNPWNEIVENPTPIAKYLSPTTEDDSAEKPKDKDSQ